MLKLAVVGVGRMGAVHAKNILHGRVKNAVLAAVCDLCEEKLTSYACKKYTDYRVMLEEVKPDGVIIATEHYFHVEIAVACIERGINVLIEKPVSVTTQEAERLIACMNEHKDVQCAVMYNQRTNAMYEKAREIVKSGKIGELRRVNYIVTGWYRAQAYYNQGGWRASLWGEGGGTLINQCVHQLDILQWITGMPVSVTATTATVNRNITTENEATVLFRYENGACCTFTSSAHELNGVTRLEIAGDKGRIVIGDYSMKYYLFDKDEKQVNERTEKGYGSAKKCVRRKTYGRRLLSDLLFGQQLNIVKNFCNALEKKEKLISPATDGIYALSLINAVYLSSWTGKTVPLPLDGAQYAETLAAKIQEEKQLLSKTEEQ